MASPSSEDRVERLSLGDRVRFPTTIGRKGATALGTITEIAGEGRKAHVVIRPDEPIGIRGRRVVLRSASTLTRICLGCDGSGWIYPMASAGDTSRNWVERCDLCKKWPDDCEAAIELLVWMVNVKGRDTARLGLAHPFGAKSLTPFIEVVG